MTLSSPNPTRFLSCVRIIGLIVSGLVASIQSVPAQAADGVATTVSGQKTKAGDQPGLMTIEGTVVDESGSAVPKTRVRLYTHALKGSVPTSLADAQGRFRFSVDLATTRYLTFVADSLIDGKKAYTSIHEEGTLGLPTPLKLVLKPPRILIVEVRDLEGEPAADAYVEASTSVTSLANGHSEHDGSLRLTLPVDAKVDSVFALKSGLGLDYWTGYLQPGGVIQDLPEKLVLTLNGARRVRVQAIDSSARPVSGVMIRPWTIQKPGKSFYVNLSGGFMSRAVESITDTKGIATIDWIPVEFMNRINFLIGSKDFHLPQSPIATSDMNDDVELTMTLQATTKISGAVLAEDGKPAAGILLQAEGRGQSNHYFRNLTRTDAEGHFEFNAYPDQAYLVAILNENWSAPSLLIPKIEEGESVSGVELRLSKGTVIRGVVTGEGGKSRTNVTVTLIQTAQTPGDAPINVNLVRWARTDSEGRYHFRVGPGTFDLMDPDYIQTIQLKIESEPEVIQDLVTK